MMALKLADYVVNRRRPLLPILKPRSFSILYMAIRARNLDVAATVASVRALNMHGGVPKEQVSETNLDVLQRGFLLI